MNRHNFRRRRSVFKSSEDFVEKCPALRRMVRPGCELREKVLRERVEVVDVGQWSDDLASIRASTLGDDVDGGVGVGGNFDNFVMMAASACIAADKDGHLKECLGFFPDSESRINHELVRFFIGSNPTRVQISPR